MIITKAFNTPHNVLNTAELPVGTAQFEWPRRLQQWLAPCFLQNRSAVKGCVFTLHGLEAASIDSCIGGLPVFLEPSSSELSALLATINSKVLLPEHLTRDQQKLIYKQAMRAKLETEPVEVTIGDVTLPLEQMDRNFRPNRWESLREVVAQSETAADWENVVRVLEGYHSAGIAIKPQWQAMVVRHLTENGDHHIVLKALQRVKATGLRLSNYSVTQGVLKGAHNRAAESDWDKEETVKALRYARQVVELMEDKEHHAVLTKGSKTTQTDWRGEPFVIAVPTELAAMVAQKYSGDKEVVKTLANRLVNALKQGNQESIDAVAAFNTKSEADYTNKTAQTAALVEYCGGLAELIIVWNALKTSRAVLGAEMPLATEAAEHESRIKKVLDEANQVLSKLQQKGGVQLRSKYPAYITEQLQKCQA